MRQHAHDRQTRTCEIARQGRGEGEGRLPATMNITVRVHCHYISGTCERAHRNRNRNMMHRRMEVEGAVEDGKGKTGQRKTKGYCDVTVKVKCSKGHYAGERGNGEKKHDGEGDGDGDSDSDGVGCVRACVRAYQSRR